MHATEAEPAERFAAVLQAAGGNSQSLAVPREIAGAIARVARGQAAREILYEPTALVDRLGLKLLLAAHGIELVTVGEAGVRAAELKVSLTGAELAIAETGTLLVGGRPGGWGLATVLPWVHVVLLPAGRIVADLPAAFERFAARLSGGEGDWVWITGPSRTADIGHKLVLGAHGPNALEVVIVE